jgi:hypothetical protein
VRDAAMSAMQAIVQLYRHPSAEHWREADAAVHAGILAAVGQPVRQYLYHLRSTLRDDESPFAAFIPPPSSEPVHAA